MSDEATSEEAVYDCLICRGDKDYNHLTKCAECGYWYHLRCLMIDPDLVLNATKENSFKCTDCCTPSQIRERSGMDAPGPSGKYISPPRAGDESEPEEEQARSNTSQQDTDVDTDSQGNSEVSSIVDWRCRGRSREFQVEYKKDSSVEWFYEHQLLDCLDLVNEFCLKKNLHPSKYQTKVGASKPARGNQDNWATIEQVLHMAQTYGNKSGLQPQILKDSLGKDDAIYLVPIGSHCYAVMFIAKQRICYVADGENVFRSNKASRMLLINKLKGAANIVHLQFEGQTEADHCASSAAGIAIEFQRLYPTKQFPLVIRVAGSTLDRIRQVLHKQTGPRIREWKKAPTIQWKVECEKCHAKFNTKNRSALNLHKCPE